MIEYRALASCCAKFNDTPPNRIQFCLSRIVSPISVETIISVSVFDPLFSVVDHQAKNKVGKRRGRQHLVCCHECEFVFDLSTDSAYVFTLAEVMKSLLKECVLEEAIRVVQNRIIPLNLAAVTLKVLIEVAKSYLIVLLEGIRGHLSVGSFTQYQWRPQRLLRIFINGLCRRCCASIGGCRL